MDDDYKPRKNDHLVEPFLAGLGHGDQAEPGCEELRARKPGLFARLVRRFLRRSTDDTAAT